MFDNEPTVTTARRSHATAKLFQNLKSRKSFENLAWQKYRLKTNYKSNFSEWNVYGLEDRS